MSQNPVAALVVGKANPIRTPVEGSPWQPGQRVRVAALTDNIMGERGKRYVGQVGTIEHLEYECGCGQRYPFDPMIGVRFDRSDLPLEEFWAEELAEVTP